MGNHKEKIINLIDEDIDILRETLYNFHKMNVKGVDNISSSFMRKCKDEFIEQAKQDIDWMLNLRRNHDNKII